MPKLRWNQWRAGLLIASATAIIMALANWAANPCAEAKGLLVALALQFGREVVPFLRKHPVETLGDTVIIERSREPSSKPTSNNNDHH